MESAGFEVLLKQLKKKKKNRATIPSRRSCEKVKGGERESKPWGKE